MDLERVASNSEYTPLLHVCQSLYDPYGNKLDAVRLLIEKGANTRAVCRTFAYSSLHLILLSTRDEVYHLDGELWKGNSEDLREALVLLVRGEADIGAQNKWALTPSDLAIGLKCVPSWNDAMYECGFPEHAVDDSFDANPFGQDLVKQAVFEKFWEDYNHFSRWDCKPNSCFRGCYRQWRGSREDQCPWWDDYEFNWLPHWKWNLMYDDWEEL
ncbi:MAG: hypothetical protein LQ342_007980 [Letrouitia transgressa]|nr:MAG: hypothetical protein LQ342_007980 [Letrouitia transgressa]